MMLKRKKPKVIPSPEMAGKSAYGSNGSFCFGEGNTYGKLHTKFARKPYAQECRRYMEEGGGWQGLVHLANLLHWADPNAQKFMPPLLTRPSVAMMSLAKSAAELLAAYGYGRPANKIEMGATDGKPVAIQIVKFGEAPPQLGLEDNYKTQHPDCLECRDHQAE